MNEPQQKKRRGCLFYFVTILALVLLTGVLGLYVGVHTVNQLTDTHPATLPTAQMPEAQLFQLRDRVDTFKQAIRDGEPTTPLELSADELNALIATDPALSALKDHLYVSIVGSELRAQVSFPAEDLSFDSLHGRYVNADGVFTVSLSDGELKIFAESLTAKGKPIPRQFMRKIASQNLAHKFNEDPKATAGLAKLKAIQVKDGKLIIEAKK